MAASLPSPAGRPSRRARLAESAGALILALLLTALIDAFSGVMPPRWDAIAYVDMANNGLLDNPGLIAPFLYRPAIPLTAGWLARALDVPVEAAFQGIIRISAVIFLFAVFHIARRFTASPARAILPVLFLAASAMHVKLPVFFTTMVDGPAFALMALTVWAFVAGRPALCFWLALAGLFFKEFMAIPFILIVAEFVRAWRRDRTPRRLAVVLGASALGLAAVLIPRLTLPVVFSTQEVDPFNNPSSLARLVTNLFDVHRNTNLVYAGLSYWLPSLLLLTKGRLRGVRRTLMPAVWPYAVAFLALDALLALYGGTNMFIFFSYGMPVQLLVLAALTREKIPAAEWALALAATVIYNRIFLDIPQPAESFAAYIDFYGGWHTRVNLSTLWRTLEMAAYLALMLGARRLLARRAPAPVDAGTGQGYI